MLILVWTLLSSARADVVRVLVDSDGTDIQLIDAWVVPGRVGVVEPGPVQVLDTDGRVLASAAVRGPGHRSTVFPEGGGAATDASSDAFIVDVPWVDGAAKVTVATQELPIRRGVLAGGGATLVQGDGSSNRQDLVVLGDGYTAAQLGAFADDVDEVVAHLGIIEPYSAYTQLFNIWRVDVSSTESGADHPSRGEYRDTALDCAYDCGGIERLICCAAGTVVSTASAAVPQVDGVLVLVNDPQYGGSGGSSYASSYNGSVMGDVSIHELGHTLPGLWDEYSYGYARGFESPAPNCAWDPNDTPWEHWRDEPGVGAFSQCSYTDYYRPTNTGCLMNILQDHYCVACREHVVRQFYTALDGMIATASPPEGTVAIGDGAARTFTIGALGPDDGSVTITWTLDGVELQSSTAAGGGESLSFGPCEATTGTLVAEVADLTDWVRSDPGGLLDDRATWTLTAPDADGDGVPDSCEGPPLTLAPLDPGLAGVDNTWVATNAVGGATIALLASPRAGTTPVPGCPGVSVPLDRPRLLDRATADGAGVAISTIAVPASLAGKSGLLVAVDRDRCQVSNTVAPSFP